MLITAKNLFLTLLIQIKYCYLLETSMRYKLFSAACFVCKKLNQVVKLAVYLQTLRFAVYIALSFSP